MLLKHALNNFHKFGTRIPNSNQVELRAPNGQKHPWYISYTGAPDSIFYISPPLLDNYDYEQKYGRWNFYRDEAESDFLSLLGISQQDACKLNVELGFAGIHEEALADVYAGKNFGLSFCPSGIPISPLPSAVHRRLKEWAETDVLLNLWRAFLNQLSDRQKVRWDECFIDGMFSRAKKGVHWSGRLRAAREQSLWYWPMARVLRSEYTWRRLPLRMSSSSRRHSIASK